MTLRPDASPCTIGDVCDFDSGNGFRPQDWKTQGLPIIRIQNLNGSDSFNYFDGEPDPAWIVEPYDLLFAWAMALRVGSGLPNIQKSDVEALLIVLPDLATQTAIARYLNALREEIDLLGQSVAALETQKRGLMQKLLTGRWRLPVQEEAT